MRKHFSEIQGREDFHVKVHFSFIPFQKVLFLPQNEADFNSNCKWSIVAN